MVRGRLVLLPRTTRKAGKYTGTICLKAVRRFWDTKIERLLSFWRGKNSERWGNYCNCFYPDSINWFWVGGREGGGWESRICTAETLAREKRNQQIFWSWLGRGGVGAKASFTLSTWGCMEQEAEHSRRKPLEVQHFSRLRIDWLELGSPIERGCT